MAKRRRVFLLTSIALIATSGGCRSDASTLELGISFRPESRLEGQPLAAAIEAYGLQVQVSESSAALPEISISVHAERVRLGFPPGWLERHPMTRLELEREAARYRAFKVRLEYD